MTKYQLIIGRAEEIDITGHALNVPAKIDTGAFRSSIHATDIRVVKEGSKKQLHFKILGHRCAPVARDVVVDNFEKTKVRSSNGEVDSRYIVTFKVKIGPKIFNTSFSLTDRNANVYPVLVGRDALAGRFLVDPSKATVTRQKLAKQFGIKLDSPEDFED